MIFFLLFLNYLNLYFVNFTIFMNTDARNLICDALTHRKNKEMEGNNECKL